MGTYLQFGPGGDRRRVPDAAAWLVYFNVDDIEAAKRRVPGRQSGDDAPGAGRRLDPARARSAGRGVRAGRAALEGPRHECRERAGLVARRAPAQHEARFDARDPGSLVSTLLWIGSMSSALRATRST